MSAPTLAEVIEEQVNVWAYAYRLSARKVLEEMKAVADDNLEQMDALGKDE